VGVKASGVELEMEGVRKFKEDVANKVEQGDRVPLPQEQGGADPRARPSRGTWQGVRHRR